MSGAGRKALGRGLDALLPPAPAAAPAPTAAPARRDYFLCPVDEIRPSPDQPRRRFSDEALDSLAATIRERGVVQPLLVRRDPSGRGFLIIAGERRWRAAQRAGRAEVPVVVRDVAPRESFELALIENLHREDLDPLEEAEAYQLMAAEWGLGHEAIAARVGKDRSTVANAIRLLALPPRARELLLAHQLSAGHARALLGLEAPDAIERAARHVAARALSVRQTEALVRRLRRPREAQPGASAAVRDVEARLRRRLGTKVRLAARADGSGRIEIDYGSLDELDRLLAVILR